MSRAPLAHGFSLLEMAIVLVVLGVLARATLVPLAGLHASRLQSRMHDELQHIRDALVAELVGRGALPCPLLDTATGASSCPLRGHLPAAALSLSLPSDANGAALDPWGRPYVYARSDVDSEVGGTLGVPDWDSLQEIVSVGIPELRGSLSVCRRAQLPCNNTESLATDLVFVVLSHGEDASNSDLQRLNRDSAGAVFTLAAPSTVAGYRFDDGLVWLSRSEAVWWLLRAHRLP